MLYSPSFSVGGILLLMGIAKNKIRKSKISFQFKAYHIAKNKNKFSTNVNLL